MFLSASSTNIKAILQFYVIWFTIDTGNRELMKQLDCMTKTWVLVGLSVLKFSVDSAQNVRAFPIDEVKVFDRGQVTEFLDYYTDKKVPGKLPIGLLYYATSITSRCILIAITVYYLPIGMLIMLGVVHLGLVALPCFVIGSYCKSFFEEARRKLKGKKRKVLWKLFYYLVVAVPSVYLMWLSTLFTWVDVYGVPATKPCMIKTHSKKREKRRNTSYASVLIYYFLVVFGENLLLSAYFYILRKDLVYSQQNSMPFSKAPFSFVS